MIWIGCDSDKKNLGIVPGLFRFGSDGEFGYFL